MTHCEIQADRTSGPCESVAQSRSCETPSQQNSTFRRMCARVPFSKLLQTRKSDLALAFNESLELLRLKPWLSRTRLIIHRHSFRLVGSKRTSFPHGSGRGLRFSDRRY